MHKEAEISHVETSRCLVPKADAVSKPSASIIQRKERKQKSLKRPLRILQWDAEDINTKMSELRSLLEEYKIDSALIQESKLTKEKDTLTPDIRGYNDYRGNRKGMPEGDC